MSSFDEPAGRTRTDLTDRVVLVTGGSAGIGYATARRLAARGADVVISARQTPRLESARASLAAEIERPVAAIAADLASPEERERLVRLVIERHRRLDAVVNNAAVGRVGKLADLDAEGVCEVVTTNFLAVADLTRLALPHVRRERGDVVMVASALAWFPAPPLSLYSATKAGVHGLVAALRREEARDVRVHEILPGLVATEWLAYAMGWRPTDTEPRTAKAIGTAPDRVASAVERCLTSRSARTLAVPRMSGLTQLAALPPARQVADLLGPRVAPRLVEWARRYGRALAERNR